MAVGFNKVINSVDLINGCLYRVRATKLEVRNKDNQPTDARIRPSIHNLGKNVVKGIGGILEKFDIWFGTSDVVLSRVDLNFNVTRIAWQFCLG